MRNIIQQPTEIKWLFCDTGSPKNFWRKYNLQPSPCIAKQIYGGDTKKMKCKKSIKITVSFTQFY